MDLGRFKLRAGQLVSTALDEVTSVALQSVITTISQLAKDVAQGPGPVYFPASVSVTKGQALNIFNGKFRLADKTLGYPAQAVATAGATAGQFCTAMLLTGYVAGLGGLTANSVYYLSTAGGLTAVKPGTGLIQSIGYALSTTELLVNISQP